MKENISPEERLLRLIKGQKRQGPSRIDESGAGIKELRPQRRPAIRSLIQKIPPILNGQKVIFLVFLASCVYLVISLIYPLVGLRKINLPPIPPQKIVEQEAASGQEVKPYEFYSEASRSRQIFNSTSTQEMGRPDSGVDIDLLKDITLVGIISGENPQAVIEDTRARKTYYATIGQFVKEFQVAGIQEGKVILNYKGQKYELYL